MEKVLSQREIDALISAVTGQAEEQDEGGRPPQQVGTYDFRSPSRFSREQLRALERIHEQFCRVIGNVLSGRMQMEVDFHVLSVQQLSYGEFIHSLPNPSVIAVYDAGGLGGSLLVQVSFDLIMAVYDRMCGGPGQFAEGRPRELTDIELAIIRKYFFSVLADGFAQVWDQVADMQLHLTAVESNPLYLGLMLDQDAVVVVSLEAGLAGHQEMVNICIPYSSLEPVLSRLTGAYLHRTSRKPSPEEKARLADRLHEVEVEIEVVLGQAQVTVEDLLEMSPDDVVVLDRSQDEDLHVTIGGQVRFLARPGRIGDHLGIVITGENQEAVE